MKSLIDNFYGFCINQLLNSKPTEVIRVLVLTRGSNANARKRDNRSCNIQILWQHTQPPKALRIKTYV